jgi:protein required for attachment to host cells
MPGHKCNLWVLIADGAHAQIYIAKSASPPKLAALKAGRFVGAKTMTRDLESDRPGVTFESVGGGRHAIERRSNAHQRLEDNFVKTVADVVNKAARSKQFDEIILVSPPRALAQFRKTFSKATQAKTKLEIKGDWTKLTKPEIESHLTQHLPY